MKPSKLLTQFDMTIIMVSFVIGMGIFRTPVNVAQSTGTPFLFFSVWIMGGLVAICGALTYAEIGSRIPVTGGYYRIFAFAYHPSIAFAVNCIIIVSNAASLGAVALIGGEYITAILIPRSQNLQWISASENTHYIQNIQLAIAVFAIIIFYAINLVGLKMSAKAQNILTIIKLLMIVMMICPLFLESGNTPKIASLNYTSTSFNEYLKAFGVGLVAVCFTYGGYQQTINFGEEVVKPKKTIPRSIFYGIAIIVILYLSINYAYVKVIGFEELKTSKNIAAIMASKVFGVGIEHFLSVLLFLSVLAYVNILMMSNPRVMAAMSDDHILPPAFKKRNPKTEVLTTSLTVFSSLCILIIFWAKEFDIILSFTIFLDSIGMALSAGSIFMIRKRTRHLDTTGIYKMKLYPLLPLIFIFSYSFVAMSILISQTRISLVGIAVLISFIFLFFVVRNIRNKKM